MRAAGPMRHGALQQWQQGESTHMHILHRTSGAAVRRAWVIGLCGVSLAGCVTVTTTSGSRAKAANEPAGEHPARSLPTQGQGASSARPQAAPIPAAAKAAPQIAQPPAKTYTRTTLANTYSSYEETDMGFRLILRKDGSSVMEIANGDQLSRIAGRWRVEGDRVTVDQTVRKKTERLVYVVRDVVKPADVSANPGCKGSFGLQAVAVPKGEDLDEHRIWPLKAIEAGQAPCRK